MTTTPKKRGRRAAPKPAKVELPTEAQLFGNNPGAVVLDELHQVPTGYNPSEEDQEARLQALAAAEGHALLACQDRLLESLRRPEPSPPLPTATRNLADWIAEEATQGRFYGSKADAEEGYAQALRKAYGGAR